MHSAAILLSLAGASWAAPSRAAEQRRAVSPQVSGTPQVVANVTDPSVSRDSCGSMRLGSRALWTCRDTMAFDASTGASVLPLVANTASWTDFASDGSPDIVSNAPAGAGSSGSSQVLLMYNGSDTSYDPFYPILADECPGSGLCADGTRWAVWPDSPPMLASTAANGTAIAYTWIPRAHLSGLALVTASPGLTLYKLTYQTSDASAATPAVETVAEQFWKHGEWGYGDYGNVVRDGVAYLYAQDGKFNVALAKVPVAGIEDRSQYKYYVGGKWTSTMPAMDDSAAYVTNAGTGSQGTFYYSEHLKSYVWIGQGAESVVADFMLTTAPAPHGPWIKPYLIYSGENGDSALGAYSLQAHPALLKSTQENAIYLSWTQQFETSTYGAYVTPLVYVQFQ